MSGGGIFILLAIGLFGLVAFIVGLTKRGLRNKGVVYTGDMKDGRRHGQGTLAWKDGTLYVGEFKNGQIVGPGTLTKADGRKYVGYFKDGTPHGKGTLTYSDGTVKKGTWKDGEYLFPNLDD
jgi:hypothetical protein